MRSKTKSNLQNQANKMKKWTNKILLPAKVNSTVRIPIPDIDKGRGNA